MFQRGDQVLYGMHGACNIIGLEVKAINHKNIEYYVLEPVEQPGSRYYIPIQNEAAVAKLRPIMTQDQLDVLLHSEDICKDTWVSDENQRKQRYRDLLAGGDSAALLRMVHTLHKHKQEKLSAGQKLHLCDENFLRDAKKILQSEFALILNIDRDEVRNYVMDALNID